MTKQKSIKHFDNINEDEDDQIDFLIDQNIEIEDDIDASYFDKQLESPR